MRIKLEDRLYLTDKISFKNHISNMTFWNYISYTSSIGH